MEEKSKVLELVAEYSFVDELELNKCDKEIDHMIEAKAYIVLNSHEIIKTCTGYKVAIKGERVVELIYVARNSCGKVISKKFSIPFFEVIAINKKIKITKLTSEIEYCEVMNDRCNAILFYNIVSIKINFFRVTKLKEESEK